MDYTNFLKDVIILGNLVGLTRSITNKTLEKVGGGGYIDEEEFTANQPVTEEMVEVEIRAINGIFEVGKPQPKVTVTDTNETEPSGEGDE